MAKLKPKKKLLVTHREAEQVTRERGDELAGLLEIGERPKSLSLADIASLTLATDSLNPMALMKILKKYAIHNPSVFDADGQHYPVRDGDLYVFIGQPEIWKSDLLGADGKPIDEAARFSAQWDGTLKLDQVDPHTKLFTRIFQALWIYEGRRPLAWFWLTKEDVIGPPTQEPLGKKRERVIRQVCERMIQEGELDPRSRTWSRSSIFAEAKSQAPALFAEDDQHQSFKRPYLKVRKEIKKSL